MSIEDHVIALIDEGNPVPDPDDLVVEPIDVPAYLATLSRWSSEMTKVETETIEERDEKRPALPWLAAAVVVVILGVVAILMNQDTETPPAATEPAPASTVPEAIEEATLPTPTTIIDAAEAEWEAIPPFFGGPAGHYRVQGFEPEFSFDAPDGWNSPGDSLGDYVEMYRLEDRDKEITGGVYFFRRDNTTPDGQVNRFLDSDDFDTTATESVSVGGAEGVRLLLTPVNLTTFIAVEGLGTWSLDPSQGEYIFYVLDVGGQTVVVIGEGAAGRIAVDDIVTSIVWKDLR